MIPKVIHYCWFGGNRLPEFARKCIASWKMYLPDYEIKEWNEENFNVNCCDYVREAYCEKKWAFVSDYARFYILYHEGGLYFDTDVEIISSLDKIIDKGAFIGCEETKESLCGNNLGVNPGLGLAASPGLELYKEILEFYESIHFSIQCGTPKTIVDYTTAILRKHGWEGSGQVEGIEGIYIYPPEYFCPYNYITGKWNVTCNTVSIHHYTATWLSSLDKFIMNIECTDYYAHPLEYKLRRAISFPFRIVKKLKQDGLLGVQQTILDRLRRR